MKFESHIERVLQVTVCLVNRLTPGHSGGREVFPVATSNLVPTVTQCLGVSVQFACTEADAAQLLQYAQSSRIVIQSIEAGDLESAAVTVNRLLRETGARPQLDQHGSGWNLHFHGQDDSVGIGWAAGGAAALALIVGSDRAERLGVCVAPVCDRVYLDMSKNGSRTFCSKACQSRV
ncbi:CGNR zinc finger domain-containing protein, partial [Deinococcus depolymerans]